MPVMAVMKAVNNIKNFNAYITFTQEHVSKYENSQVPLNMSSVLALKKICYFEVEYFSKYQETGAAFTIFEKILKWPPSKTWSLLANDLISLLKYWIEGSRKYLIKHCTQWWQFVEATLKLINLIKLKDASICNILAEQVFESLLDLATSDQLDLEQKYEVIRCLNHCSQLSSREVRSQLSNKFNGYFVKLCLHMCTCNHWPSQLVILELVLRWLVRRQDAAARRAAAAVWFPEPFPRDSVQVFLERPFVDFFKDARDFLNALNKQSDHVTSVICRKLTIGIVPIISPTDSVISWLDLNSTHASATVLLHPRLLPSRDTPHDLLTVRAEHAQCVQLTRDNTQLTILISMSNEPQFLYESTMSILDEDRDKIKISISSKCDVKSLDDACRRTFGDKYHCGIEMEGIESTTSPSGPVVHEHETYSRFSNSEHEEARFSNSYEIPMSNVVKTTQRKKRASGFAKKQVSGWQSPSTISTTSLAQLPHKLAALPRLYYVKEPISVLAHPNLSCVTEVSEPDSFEAASTVKLVKPCGFVTRHTKFIRKSKTSPSDNEDVHRCISPEHGHGNNSSKSLLYITIGSTDDSGVNVRSEQNKNNNVDLAELSLREALLNANKKDKNSRFNAENSVEAATFDFNSEAIDNTPEASVLVRKNVSADINKQNTTTSCTVISKSTSDESNTESLRRESITARNDKAKIAFTSDDSNMTDNIAETPVNYVSERRKTIKYKSASKNTIIRKDLRNKEKDKPTYNIEDMEDFFSQHFQENKNGDLILSPTLARKINESSSDSSDSFDKYIMSNIDKADQADINDYEVDVDIIACLTSMVDKVCNDLDKCAEYLDKEKSDLELLDKVDIAKDGGCIDTVIYADESNNVVMPVADIESDVLKVKLSFNKKNAKKGKKVVNNKTKNKKNKLIIKSAEPTAAQGTENDEDIDNNIDSRCTAKQKDTAGNESDTPHIVMKKRKLFSPNDGKDENNMDKIEPYYKDDESKKTPTKSTKLQTPQSAATSYKDIENDRKKLIRQTRNRRSKSKASPLISPKTLKNNVLFEQIKENIDSTNIKLVDKKTSEHDIAVYNFTSDSEDEDFKMKKGLLAKNKSEAAIVNTESQSSKRGRPLKRRMYTESKTNSSTDETNIHTNLSKRKAPRRQNTKGKGRKPKKCIDQKLEDERMRDAGPEPTVTSPIVKKRAEVIIAESVEPILNIVPEMEVIPEVEETAVVDEVPENKVNKKKIDKTLSLKKGKKAKVQKDTIVAEPEKKNCESPLPALIIESDNIKFDDGGSICSSNLMKKCNNVMQGGEVNNDTTQNLLSDNDKVNDSPEAQLLPIEIEIIDKLEDKTKRKNTDSVKPKKLGREPKISQPEEIVLLYDPEDNDEDEGKSVATVVVSPPSHRIETLSMTAHCDRNESLNEKILPRNLELEDMSTSMKDYFIALRNQTNDDKRTSDTSVKQAACKSTSSKDHESVRSPVVSIKRLDEDDFRKWLPSPKSSDSEAFQPKSKIVKPKTTPNVNSKKSSQTKANSISSTTKVSDNTKNVKKTQQNKNIGKTADKSKETSKFLKKTTETDKMRLKLNQSESDTDEPRYNLQSKRNASQLRRTVISPISIDLTEDDDDDETSHTSEEPNETNITKQYTQRFARTDKTVRLVEKHTKYNAQSSSEEPSLNVTETSEISRKRKMIASHSEESSAKNRRVEQSHVVSREYFDNVASMSESGPSIASVKEWFVKGAQLRNSAKDDIRSTCNDFVENVLEKLDTTLSEIQQGTSSKYVHMFVDMQEYYNKMKEENTRMFEQLLKRQDERFEEFKDFMKQRAVGLIKEDYTQKKAMVDMLREDLENVMEQLNRRKTY